MTSQELRIIHKRNASDAERRAIKRAARGGLIYPDVNSARIAAKCFSQLSGVEYVMHLRVVTVPQPSWANGHQLPEVR